MGDGSKLTAYNAGNFIVGREIALLRIKICGVTRIKDAQRAAELGADAVGLNFVSASPRFVRPEQAREIAAVLPDGTRRVGVFVDTVLEELLAITDVASLDAVQLHGTESPDFAGRITDHAVIKAFRCRDGDLQPAVDYLVECESLGSTPNAVLLDAWSPDAAGGTGQTLDWKRIAEQRQQFGEVPVILAGGLTPDNIAEAIEFFRPDGVDVASGVESSPGVKDAEKMRVFMERAQAAFDG